jgi:hypothetical protein
MTVLDTLNRSVDPDTGIVIITHNYCGNKMDKSFTSGEDALQWIQKSIFDHIEQDLVSDGIEMPTSVLGQVYFTIKRTSKPGDVRCKYE